MPLLEPVPELSYRSSVARCIDAVEADATARYRGVRLASHFQPIFSAAQRQIAGYEGLLRARTPLGEPIAPLDLFEACAHLDEKVHLDRLCRAVHVARFTASGVDQGWLFLNVTPAALRAKHQIGAFFGPLLNHFGLAPERVVVEILESATADLATLERAVAYYKALGCLVAVDDFGVDASDIRRIWQLSPHIVKLDRHIIQTAERQESAANALFGLIELLHSVGSLALIEGVETAGQLKLAVDANADLVQGYYLARPGAELPLPDEAQATVQARLEAAFAAWQPREALIANTARCIQLLTAAAAAISDGTPLASACAPLFGSAFLNRVYLTDADGHVTDVGTAECPGAAAATRFGTLIERPGTNISRRHHISAAIVSPGHVQVGRPSLSISQAGQCLPLAVAIRVDDRLRVLFCELSLPDLVRKPAAV